MVNHIINFLHKKKLYRLNCILSVIFYFLKGYGHVRVKYYPYYRAYEFKVKGISYLSLGPGWAYSYDYLHSLLVKSFCFFYHPKPGDCIVDIGAGLGEESLIIAQMVGNTGSVFAVEANPITYSALQHIVNANYFFWVKPLNLALYKEDGFVNIEDDEDNYLGNTINKQNGQRVFKVKALTLDSLIQENNIKHIDYLKCNIEGAEKFLIKGMSSSTSIVKNVCISCHDFRHTHHGHGEFYLTKSEVKNFLIEQGFEVLTQNSGVPHIDDFVYARRK